MRRTALALAALGALAAPARADSWGAPQPQVAFSEDGGTYVIVRPKPGRFREGEFVLVRVGPGKDPLPQTPPPAGAPPGPVVPRADDPVLAKGDCFVPMEVRCRNGGRGFVLFETYASLGNGVAAAAYDGRGREVWRKSLPDLFTPEEVQAFPRTASSTWWYLGLWLDEAAEDLVVLAEGATGWGPSPAGSAVERSPPRILRLALKDGSSRAGAPEDLLVRVGRGETKEQVAALDAALDLRPAGLFEAARKNLGRAELALPVRLRLAVALAQGGDPAGKDLVIVSAQEGTERDARMFAIRHLPTVLGPAALPVLREAVRKTDYVAWSPAVDAFAALGGAAVPTLVEMLEETDGSADSRGAAVAALGRIGPAARPALPALLRAVGAPPPHVAAPALDAAEAIVPADELGPLLVPLLVQGSGSDGSVASFFAEHPLRAAIPAPIEALDRHDADPEDPDGELVVAALVRSSGATGVGRTAALWRAWWARNR